MMTVTISFNGEPFFHRMVRNHSEKNEKGETKYITDAGDVVWHVRNDGAIDLAKKVLDTIKTEHV